MIYGPQKRTVGDVIYDTIDDNQYLIELYNKLLLKYTRKIFDRSIELFDQKELKDLLTFADVLSSSNHLTKSGVHKIWSQQIVALLSKLYPDDKMVQFYKIHILTNCFNYEGLKKEKVNFTSDSALDNIVSLSNKSYYSIPNRPDDFFFPDQKSIFDGFEHEYFSYSAPTSLGKSFVMRVFIKQQIIRNSNKNFAILVPTKALINETRSKLIEDLGTLLEEKNYRVIVSASDLMLEQDHKFIFVMTPERFLYLINTKKPTIDYLFVDEAHKISTKDKRSAFYYKVVDKITRNQNKPHIIFASPNIPNPQEYLRLIPEKCDKNKERTIFSPVSQIKYLIDLENGKTEVYNDYSKVFTKIGNASRTTLPKLIKQVSLRDDQSIVYCSSLNDTIDLAEEYGNSISDDEIHFTKDEKTAIDALSNEIKNEIHSDYFLVELIKKGVAYHVGYLPANIRLKIESSFKNGIIKTLFCTSTLIEGVNLPADNLFITSYKNGRQTLDEVSFRNLIGRVGRIDHSLFGNVFMIAMNNKDNKPIEEYVKLVNKDIPDQKLSIEKALSRPQKNTVINSLLNEDYIMSTKNENTTFDQFSFMRKMSLIAISDIQSGTESLVTKDLIQYMTDDQINQLKIIYKNKPSQRSIDISNDQILNLKNAIENGLKYPDMVNGEFDYETVVEFLKNLADVFNWREYENQTLGHCYKDTNTLCRIGYYAVILSQWMSGKGLRNIIDYAIKYKEKHPETGIWLNNWKFIDIYEKNNSKHKNYIIGETLNVIENAILFNIANYFREFSEEYKLRNNINGYMPNDWYEYVEFGTPNEQTIILQKIGYSRESAANIKEKADKYIAGPINKLYPFSLNKNNLLNSSDIGIATETKDIVLNVPDIFS